MTYKSLRNFILLLFLLIAFQSNSQDTTGKKPKVLFGLKDLHEVDSSEFYSIVGEFVLSFGFGGISYTVDGKGFYKERNFSCLDDFISDSGRYKMTGKNTVKLISKFQRVNHFIYRFDKFYFLVPVKENENFKKDFLKLAKDYYGLKDVKLSDERYTDQFFIALHMTEKYPTKLDYNTNFD